jgi:hypothetical protein
MTQPLSDAPASTAAPMAIALEATCSDLVSAWTHPEVAAEVAGAWACAIDAWGDYVRRLAVSQSPLAVFEAGARLMTDSLEVCSRAAGARLRVGGALRAPLLNDA